MFWETKDPPSHNIEILLESPDTKVELFLEEDNIIQECKTLKKNIVNYFTRPDVIRRMIELITTEPSDEVPLTERYRYANVACEILTMGLPSLDEKLLADTDTLNMFYSYLENEPPLNPLLASFFSKTFSMLFTKKSDQDWFLYQQTCLKLLEYLKTKSNFLDMICKHFATPIVPDLIMEMMQNVEGEVKRNLYEWLNEERLVEKLIEIIGDPEQSEKHGNVADFLCDLVHQGRAMRQESTEPVFVGSDPILKKIESATTLLALFNVILQPNTAESAIVSGITVVLKIIKPAKVADERNMERVLSFQAREEEIRKEFLTTVIRVIEPQIKQFNELLKTPPKKSDIVTSAATLSPPFGMARLQIVRLFSELLDTKNDEILKAICETDFLDSLLALFKEYCWNNFLHSEVEKCVHCIFPYTDKPPKTKANNNDSQAGNVTKEITDANSSSEGSPKQKDETSADIGGELTDSAKGPACSPSDIQIHAIVNCQIISKLIECWKMNKEIECAEKGRRLGFMGHLINIFKHITKCISESEHIGALVEKNLKDVNERALWHSIVNETDGELTVALNAQSKLLANYARSNFNAYDIVENLCALIDSDTFGRTNNDDEGGEANAISHFDRDVGLSFYVEQHRNPFNDNYGNATDELHDNVIRVLPLWNQGIDEGEELEELLQLVDSMFVFPPTQETNAVAATTTTTTTTTSSSEEYDNNANVEKSTSWSGDFAAFNNAPKKDTQFTSNFVDDYEDDEGMWTKPLGASTSALTFEQLDTKPFDPFGETNEFETNFFTNGPSFFEDDERAAPEKSSPNQLSNSLEDNTLVDETTKDITSNENKVELIKEINREEGTTSKHKSNTPDTYETEAKTEENTANNTPKSQLTNTTTAAEEIADVSTATT